MPFRNRSLQLLRTIGSTAVRAGIEKFVPLKLTAADRFVQGLGELKGAAMKMGQMLSMIDDNLVPPEWRTALTKLQSQASARPFSEIEPLLRSNIPHMDKHFSHIEPQAMHAASIGQVHIGYLKNGTKVAVKVKYPNLEEWVSKDLNSLRSLLKLSGLLPNSHTHEEVFQTIKKIFLQELDFASEGLQYANYAKFFEGNPAVKVPQFFPEYSNREVLVTQWIEGANITNWLQSGPSQLSKVTVSTLLIEVLFEELFVLNSIQSDPNPANFLVTEDNHLVLLDFGATTPLRKGLVDNYRNLTRASLTGSKEDLLQICYHMQFLKEADSQKAKDAFVTMLAIATEPFLHNFYNFGQESLSSRIHKPAFAFTTEVKFRAPPGEIVFLNRRIAGTQMMLERIGAEVPAKALLLRHF